MLGCYNESRSIVSRNYYNDDFKHTAAMNVVTRC